MFWIFMKQASEYVIIKKKLVFVYYASVIKNDVLQRF